MLPERTPEFCCMDALYTARQVGGASCKKALDNVDFGCSSASYLTMTSVANDMLLFAYLHIAMIISRCLY